MSVNHSLVVQVLAQAVVYGTPILFAALGELLAERAGVLNLGVEGMMLVGATMGFWATQRAPGPTALVLLLAVLTGAFAGARHVADPRLPRRLAAGEPDRLRAGADDLRRRPRAVVVPGQRPRPRRRAAQAPVLRHRRLRARRHEGGRARSSSTSPRSCTPRGRVSCWSRCTFPDALRPERARGRREPGRRGRDGDQRRRGTGTRTCSPAARSRGSAGCYQLAITPGWTDGDSLVGGAGWIAIALVIFSFWRAELCLVGAYLFGGLSGGLPRRSRPTATR